jgi:putative transposase
MMNSKKRKSPAEWQALVAEQQVSGLSVAAFCLKHGLVDKTFYNQRHKLGRAPGPADSPKPGFVQVQPAPAAMNASPGSVVLHHRYSRLELGAAVDPGWLAELMGALS